jgi:hypothetical protein
MMNCPNLIGKDFSMETTQGEIKVPETRFIHPHVASGGRATIAWREYGAGIVNIAVAWCSPKDHFRRDKGRQISEGRLNHYKWSCKAELTMRPNGKEYVMEQTILNIVIQHPQDMGTPEWAKSQSLFVQ